MPRQLYIPRQVLDSISSHINDAIEKAESGFWSANEDEDTLTGHLGACLKTGLHNIEVLSDEVNGIWKWSIDYAKFRGRGQHATESFLGADGIIELTLDHGYGRESKTILFQSKIDWTSSQDLMRQAILLSTWREAAIVVNYTSNSFDAYSIDSVLASKGQVRNASNKLTLKVALTGYFLKCRIGNTDLSYDARARRLVWRDIKGVLLATQFTLPHRVRIQVEAPTYKEKVNFDKTIRTDQIHDHRMGVEPEEILVPLFSDQTGTPSDMKRRLAMIYHPDLYSSFDQLSRDLVTRRMQEINAAEDDLLKRGRK